MKYIKKFEEDTNIQLKLEIAVHQNKAESVKYALKLGADPNIKDKFQGYLLFVAILNNNVEIVKELLKAGANTDIKNDFGNTPLIMSAKDRFVRSKVRAGWENDYYEENILEELIMSGADWNQKDNDGDDFFDFLIDYFRQPLREKYPEQYQEYKLRKDAEKYNIL